MTWPPDQAYFDAGASRIGLILTGRDSKVSGTYHPDFTRFLHALDTNGPLLLEMVPADVHALRVTAVGGGIAVVSRGARQAAIAPELPEGAVVWTLEDVDEWFRTALNEANSEVGEPDGRTYTSPFEEGIETN